MNVATALPTRWRCHSQNMKRKAMKFKHSLYSHSRTLLEGSLSDFHARPLTVQRHAKQVHTPAPDSNRTGGHDTAELCMRCRTTVFTTSWGFFYLPRHTMQPHKKQGKTTHLTQSKRIAARVQQYTRGQLVYCCSRRASLGAADLRNGIMVENCGATPSLMLSSVIVDCGPILTCVA